MEGRQEKHREKKGANGEQMPEIRSGIVRAPSDRRVNSAAGKSSPHAPIKGGGAVRDKEGSEGDGGFTSLLQKKQIEHVYYRWTRL